MARIDTLGNFLTDVAAAIKEKTGKTEPITPANFDTEIESIEAGGSGDEELVASFRSIIDGTNGANCTKLPNGITTIGEKAFQDCKNLALTKLPDSVTSIGDYAFDWCMYLAIAELPEGITSIGKYAFNNCRYWSALTKLPDSITSIGNYAFYRCWELALTKLPNELVSIGDDAFPNCNAITTLEIPAKVATIGSRAFESCTGLTSVTILGQPTRIDDFAFRDCPALEKVVLPNVTSVPTGKTTMFDNTPIKSGTGYIYVPDDLVDSFKNDAKWSTYANQIKPISELEV